MPATLNERVRDTAYTLQGRRLRFALWIAGKVGEIYREQWAAFLNTREVLALELAPQLSRVLIRSELRKAAAGLWFEGFQETVKAIPEPVGVLVIAPAINDTPRPPIVEASKRIGPQDDLTPRAPKDVDFPATISPGWANSIYSPPTLEQIDEVVNKTGWFEALADLGRGVAGRIQRAVSTAISVGQSTAELARSILPLFNRNRNKARTIARTEAHRVSQEFVERSISDSAGPILQGFRYVATLDERTRAHHATRDGKIFQVNQPRPRLPDGANCRCTYHAITKSFTALGVPELESLLTDGERASMDGTVPAHVHYPDWFNNQSVGRQRSIVGKGTFDMLKRQQRRADGRITWNAFAEAPGSPAKKRPIATRRGRA